MCMTKYEWFPHLKYDMINELRNIVQADYGDHI